MGKEVESQRLFFPIVMKQPAPYFFQTRQKNRILFGWIYRIVFFYETGKRQECAFKGENLFQYLFVFFIVSIINMLYCIKQDAIIFAASYGKRKGKRDVVIINFVYLLPIYGLNATAHF